MFVRKAALGVIADLLIYGGLLFLPAATIHWWRAWVFLGVVLVGAVATMAWALRGDEELLQERWGAPIQRGQPLADKILTILLLVTYCGLIVFTPLDVFRFHLLGKPAAIASSLGLLLFVAGWCIFSLCLKENTFAAPVVKHQEERRQKVIDTGPYAVVRHPMYAAGILLMVGMPLWLESWAATLAAVAPSAVLVMRIFVEERLLKRELDGYEAYTRKVRHRLIPFVW
jgi:protein-S-isoprenylcysteine O-methyltransferase Ste14